MPLDLSKLVRIDDAPMRRLVAAFRAYELAPWAEPTLPWPLAADADDERFVLVADW